MALDKNRLKAQLQAKSPKQQISKTFIPLTNLTEVKPNARTVQLQGAKRAKRSPDGVQGTTRYSFEITADLKAKLERAILEHQLNTGKKVSNSAVIRTAINKYLKTGKLGN